MARFLRAGALFSSALSLLLAASLLNGAAGAACAQERDASSADPQAQQATDPDLQARVEFEVGRTAFDERHYDEALAAFERSYALSARPQLLYNIGQAADRLRRDARALAAFEQFLAEVPETPLREVTEERIVLLRAAILAREPNQRDPAPSPPAARAETSRSLLGPAILLGAGGLLTIGGAVSLIVGVADRDRVEGARAGTTLAELQPAAERAPLLMNGGIVMLGVGLAAASAGLVWLLVPPSSRSEVSVAVVPTTGGVLVTGVF